MWIIFSNWPQICFWPWTYSSSQHLLKLANFSENGQLIDHLVTLDYLTSGWPDLALKTYYQMSTSFFQCFEVSLNDRCQVVTFDEVQINGSKHTMIFDKSCMCFYCPYFIVEVVYPDSSIELIVNQSRFNQGCHMAFFGSFLTNVAIFESHFLHKKIGHKLSVWLFFNDLIISGYFCHFS
jgi:hypothetical protein